MRRLAAVILAITGLAACHTLDDDRIPPMPVRLVFNTVADWNVYGVTGALDHRRFIKEERVPSNFPYVALSQTGFGGILLVGDVNGAPRAYDLACPVECKRDVRIVVDTEANNAYCPKCRSVYDIYTNYGHPLAGEAAERGYGLQQYYVGAGSQGEYMVVMR